MRLFTPDEANEALARLRPLAERLAEERRVIARLAEELRAAETAIAGNGGRIDHRRVGALRERAASTAARAAGFVEEIHAEGVQLKDPDRGLLDFPARHPESGETVLLCWELGEAEVAHWHGLEAGYAGRKRLPF
ncbi:MAG TPA: DUF2203 domain-containing protein [Gaiellaceae bacterium]|nr:DUF2203 domain-containing protein [Gaiellaceae bacterium]